MKRSAIGIAIVVCALTTAAWGASMTNQDFVTQAGQAGLAEIELGKLGSERGHSEQVKQFAQKMIDDHSKANAELATVAAQDDLKLPTEPSLEQKAAVTKLRGLSGRAFDKAFMAQMVADHREAVRLFTSASSDSSLDSNLRDFAQNTLPTLEHHQQDAKQLNEQASAAGDSPAAQHEE